MTFQETQSAGQAADGDAVPLTFGSEIKQAMDTFKRAYIVSLVILGVFLIPGVIGSFLDGISGMGFGLVGLAVIAVPLVPVIRKGGIAGQPRLAAGIAAVLAVLFGVLVGTVYFGCMTDGLEGPNGEGSPLGTILGVAMLAFVFFCPWLLTALRGASFLRKRSKVQQDEDDQADAALEPKP